MPAAHLRGSEGIIKVVGMIEKSDMADMRMLASMVQVAVDTLPVGPRAVSGIDICWVRSVDRGSRSSDIS